MAGPEANLWQTVKRCLPPECHVTRIENRHGGGVPDVYIQHGGVAFWVELKVANRARVNLRPEQVVWHLRESAAGGFSYVLVKCPHPPYLRAYLGSSAPLIASQGLSGGEVAAEADTPAALMEALRADAKARTLAALRPHAKARTLAALRPHANGGPAAAPGPGEKAPDPEAGGK